MRLLPSSRGVLAVLTATLFLIAALVGGCSDDPILGPEDGAPDDSGGSYSVIERLAPTDSAQAPDSTETPVPSNPKRF